MMRCEQWTLDVNSKLSADYEVKFYIYKLKYFRSSFTTLRLTYFISLLNQILFGSNFNF